MGRAKEIEVKFIKKEPASAFVRKHHYSGSIGHCSKIHFGVFLRGRLHGVLQYGLPIDKRRSLSLVKDTRWNGMIELNRMAFDEVLPKNSESRAIAITIKLIKKHYPFIAWVVSYADGCQCGDGTIYRASGFLLTGIKKNTTMLQLPNGKVAADKTFNNTASKKYLGYKKKDCTKLIGFQIRYIYFINKNSKKNLTVPILPYSEIDRRGAGMYKGERRAKHNDNVTPNHGVEGGSIPTSTLQSSLPQKATNPTLLKENT